MAAKTVTEALIKVEIKQIIKQAICLGPSYELLKRIDSAEELIIKNAINELRDLIAHRVMILSENATTLDLFNDLFEN